MVPIAKIKFSVFTNQLLTFKKMNCSIVLPSSKTEMPVRKHFRFWFLLTRSYNKSKRKLQTGKINKPQVYYLNDCPVSNRRFFEIILPIKKPSEKHVENGKSYSIKATCINDDCTAGHGLAISCLLYAIQRNRFTSTCLFLPLSLRCIICNS